MHLQPGDMVRRADLHERYGGHADQEISRTPDRELILVFLSADGPSTARIGDRGTILYTARGGPDDPPWGWDERYLREHAQKGFAVHVFDDHGEGKCKYLGEFDVVDWFDDGEEREVTFVMGRVKG